VNGHRLRADAVCRKTFGPFLDLHQARKPVFAVDFVPHLEHILQTELHYAIGQPGTGDLPETAITKI
jgi:hypothetical protein